MNKEPSVLSFVESLGGTTTFSLSELLSLLYIDDSGEILMPSTNHHWFQGHRNRNVRDIKKSYVSFLNPKKVSESGPSKDFLLSFFKVKRVSNRPPTACTLYYTDGEPYPSNEYAVPVSNEEKPQIEEFLVSLQTLSKKPDTTFHDMRRHVTEHGYFIAPLDGLHRISVLYKLSSTDSDFVANYERKATFSPMFVLVSSKGATEDVITRQMRKLSYRESKKQQKYIGTTIIDMVRDLNVNLKKTKKFSLDTTWAQYRGNKVKVKDLKKMKYSNFIENDDKKMIPLYSTLATKHHKEFMERFECYRNTTHKAPEGGGLEHTLTDFAKNKTFATYQYFNVKAIRAGSRTKGTNTRIVTAMGKKHSIGESDRSGNPFTWGLDSVHFLLLRLFEYPHTQSRLKTSFMKSTKSLIGKGCLDFDTVLTLVGYAFALCPKSVQANPTVLSTFIEDKTVEFRGSASKCKQRIQRQFSMDVIDDMFNAFDIYSSLSPETLGRVWMNICRPFYDRLKDKTGEDWQEEFDRIQFDDGIDTINIFHRMTCDNNFGKEDSKLVSQELWYNPGEETSITHSFFNFMTVFWTYHHAVCKEPKLLSKTPMLTFLRGRYNGGSLFPKFIDITYRGIPQSEVRNNGKFLGPATKEKVTDDMLRDMLDFSRTFQPDDNETVRSVVYKKLPFSVTGLIKVLSTMTLNTEEKEFNLLNMNTYMMNWVAAERTKGDDKGEKLALTPVHPDKPLHYYDCTFDVRTYKQFEEAYKTKKEASNPVSDGDNTPTGSNGDEDGTPSVDGDESITTETGDNFSVTNDHNSGNTNATLPSPGSPNSNVPGSTTNNHDIGTEEATCDGNATGVGMFDGTEGNVHETILSFLFPMKDNEGYSLDDVPTTSDPDFFDKFLALCGVTDKSVDIPIEVKDDDNNMKKALHNRNLALGLLQRVISENNNLKNLLEDEIKTKYDSCFRDEEEVNVNVESPTNGTPGKENDDTTSNVTPTNGTREKNTKPSPTNKRHSSNGNHGTRSKKPKTTRSQNKNN